MSLSQTHLDDSAQHAFETLYTSEVVPAITALESRRLLTWVISIGGGLLSTTVGIQISSGLAAVSYLAPLGVFFVFAGFFGGVGGAVWMLLRTHRDLPALYAEAMAQSLGLQFSPHRGFGRLSLFAQAGLAPITGRRALKGVFLGQLDGAPFEIAQVQDTSGLGKARFTTFQGFLLVVRYGQAFPAAVVILRDGSHAPGSNLQSVGLVDARFERRFAVFSNDQIESRVLLDPTVIEEIVHLDAAIGGNALQCAFVEQDVLAAIPTVKLPSGRDAWPSIAKSITHPQRAREMARSLFWAARLADELRPPAAWTR